MASPLRPRLNGLGARPAEVVGPAQPRHQVDEGRGEVEAGAPLAGRVVLGRSSNDGLRCLKLYNPFYDNCIGGQFHVYLTWGQRPFSIVT